MTSEDGAARRVGTLIANKYKLRRVIGRGGMGAVYDAIHSFTGKVCAVKVLDPAASHVAGYATRFLREARAAAQIGHPGICDVLDAGQDPGDGCLYLVLELLEGEDLGAAMRRGDLTTSEIVEIGAQVLDALAAAHGRGIVHRDIKPENVFLTRDDHGNLRAKLLDFGVAKEMSRGKQLHESTQSGLLIGTPYYMAPEQVSGGDLDGRADVWAAGAMLFHALSEGPPFDAPSYNKLLLKIVSEQAPSLATYRSDLPKWLIDIVDRALKSAPAERWTASQMATWLRAKGEVPMSLDWDPHEDATQRTESLFPNDTHAAAPQVDLKALTPPARSRDADMTAPQRPSALSVESQPTVAAPTVAALRKTSSSSAPSSGQPQTTPQTWERPSQPGGSRVGLVIGMIVGGLVMLVGAFTVTWWFLTREPDAPRPVSSPTHFAPDTGADRDAAEPALDAD